MGYGTPFPAVPHPWWMSADMAQLVLLSGCMSWLCWMFGHRWEVVLRDWNKDGETTYFACRGCGQRKQEFRV